MSKTIEEILVEGKLPVAPDNQRMPMDLALRVNAFEAVDACA